MTPAEAEIVRVLEDVARAIERLAAALRTDCLGDDLPRIKRRVAALKERNG